MRSRKLFSERFHPTYFFPVLFALVLLPYWIHLGTSTLWDANEAFYAETPREMLESGDWVTPRFNYELRFQKPPLAYWVVLPFYGAFGISEGSERLPMALAASVTVLLIWLLGVELFNSSTGWIAALMTATTFRLVFLARRHLVDILLVLFVVASFYALARCRRHPESSCRWLFFVWLALGFLSKGPVAVVLVGAAFALFVLWESHSAGQSARVWVGRARGVIRLRWATGLALFAAIAAPWYVMIYRRHGGEAIRRFFFEDNLGRYASMTFGPERGWTYYFGVFGADFFPWSLFFVALLVWSVSARERRRLWLARSEVRFCLVWLVVVFVFFTVARNKQEYYILALYPAAALLLADGWATLAGRAWLRRVLALATTLLLALAGTAFAILGATLWDDWLARLAGIILATGALMVLPGLYGRRDASGALLLALLLGLFYVSANLFTLPALETYKPVAPLCRAAMLDAALKTRESARFGYYRFTAPSMVFYLRRPVIEIYDRSRLVTLWNSAAPLYLLMTEEDYAELESGGHLRGRVVARAPKVSTSLRSIVNSLRSGEKMIKRVVLVTQE